MTEIRKAIWHSILNQYALVIVGFVSVAILSRLLSPEEIGVFSVATAIAFIASSIRSFGVGDYLIRERNIDRRLVQSVMGVMIVMSWSLGLSLILLASPIATYYKVDDLRNILWIMSVPFFLAPYTSIPYSLLAREMRFESILRVDLAGALTNASVSIGLALLGYSYYGLAFGALLGVVAELLIITILRPANMSWMPAFGQFRQIVKAGFFISSARTLAMASQNSIDLILGRMSQMSAVGLFSRGNGLIMFVQKLLVNSVGPTVLPHLSQVNRTGGNVAEAYLNSLALIGAFTFPVFAVVNLAAGPMIVALFGDQWVESIEVASTLAIWAILQSVHCFSGPALLAIGEERLFLLKELASISVKVPLVIVAVPYGLEWVAWGLVLSGTFDVMMISLILRSTHGITIRQLLRSYTSNFLVAAACWTSLKGLSIFIDFDLMNAWFSLLIIAGSMSVVWLSMLYLSRNIAWPFVRDIVLAAAKRFRR